MAPSMLPAPYHFDTGTAWAGNDGNWSTISIGIGSPRQYFNLLPSTKSGETWAPAPQGCVWAPKWLDCGTLRGVQATSGPEASGFVANLSSTWDAIGIYGLSPEQNLFGKANTGLYGFDTVNLDASNNIPHHVVAGISTPDFWLGVLGLGPDAASLSIEANNAGSLLSSMKTKSLTPSKSYGYTAGASYREAPSSLIIGGYDQSAFEPSALQCAVEQQAGNTTLPVTLKILLVLNSLEDMMTVPLGSSGISLSVDSTVSQLWLPKSVCDALAATLSLTFDPTTELYLVNRSSHQQLLPQQPQFTFTITANTSSKASTDVVLPCSAFDLSAGLPYYNVSTPYFPIRRAANESQYTLGRAFLQEAYIVVDWERGNFTIGQTNQGSSHPQIVTIPPLGLADRSASKLDIGAIVALAVGIAICIIAYVVFWTRRRQRKNQQRAQPESWAKKDIPVPAFVSDIKDPTFGIPELKSETMLPAELKSETTVQAEWLPGGRVELYGAVTAARKQLRSGHFELQADETEARHQLMPTPFYELEASHEVYELEGERR